MDFALQPSTRSSTTARPLSLRRAPQTSHPLGRRGRLVFIGYSPASFTVHPIQLVVFEQKVIGSVGATLNDLYKAVDLVERGVVRTVIDRTLPLEQFESGLKALERGELVGRAVLVPDR